MQLPSFSFSKTQLRYWNRKCQNCVEAEWEKWCCEWEQRHGAKLEDGLEPLSKKSAVDILTMLPLDPEEARGMTPTTWFQPDGSPSATRPGKNSEEPKTYKI
jgi:hypothetical protein